VAHEVFTWSGKEIPHIGSYGGHKWHGFWLARLGSKHKSGGIQININVIETIMQSSS